MSSHSNHGAVGILCRDFGSLPQTMAEFQRIEVKIDDAHLRKGNHKYAGALIEQLSGWHPEWFDEIVVVGDGEGDVRFCINVDNLLKQASLPSKVSGLFIGHSALEHFLG